MINLAKNNHRNKKIKNVIKFSGSIFSENVHNRQIYLWFNCKSFNFTHFKNFFKRKRTYAPQKGSLISFILITMVAIFFDAECMISFRKYIYIRWFTKMYKVVLNYDNMNCDF